MTPTWVPCGDTAKLPTRSARKPEPFLKLALPTLPEPSIMRPTSRDFLQAVENRNVKKIVHCILNSPYELPFKGRCLRLVLRIRSAHLEILEFPMGGAHLYRDNFVRFKTMWRKQNLASVIGIPKEN